MTNSIKFQWINSLNLGIAKIDQMHVTLINYLNEILALVSQKSDTKELLAAVATLEQYASIHFTDEEVLMQLVAYPGFNEHSSLHLEFTKKIGNFKKEIALRGASVAEDLALYVYHWLTQHITNEDHKIGEFLQRNLNGAKQQQTKHG